MCKKKKHRKKTNNTYLLTMIYRFFFNRCWISYTSPVGSSQEKSWFALTEMIVVRVQETKRI